MYYGTKRISTIVMGDPDGYNIGKTEGYNEGYTAGYGQGHTDGKSAGYTEGHAAGYQEGFSKGQDHGYATGYDVGYDVGYRAGKDVPSSSFWKIFQEYGNRVTYSGAFYDSWFDSIYDPEYAIAPTSTPNGLNNTFAYTNITNTKVTINATWVNRLYYTFHYAGALQSIPKLIVHRDLVFDHSFTNCKNLETLIIEGEIGQTINLQYSPYLSKESISSVLLNLVDYSGTEHEYEYEVKLDSNSWWKINYYVTPPEGFSKWQEYVASIGWNT